MPAQQDFLQACQQGNLERVNALRHTRLIRCARPR